MTLRTALAALLLCLGAAGAHAQGVPAFVKGGATANSIAKIVTNGSLGDVGDVLGDSNGRGVNPFAVQDSLGAGICTNSANSGGQYNALCLGHDASGNPTITADSRGGLGAKSLSFIVDGVTYPLGSVAVPNGALLAGSGGAMSPISLGTGLGIVGGVLSSDRMAVDVSNGTPGNQRRIGARDTINCVTEYGMVADGVIGSPSAGTDNSTAFQECYDAASAAHKTAYVPSGVYRITTYLDPDTNKLSWWDGAAERPVALVVDGVLYETGSNGAIKFTDPGIVGRAVYIRAIVCSGAGSSAPTPAAGGAGENAGLILSNATGQEIHVDSITDCTYDVLVDGAYANKLFIGTAIASYKAIYCRTQVGGTGACNANQFYLGNVGGVYTYNGAANFTARQARSSYWGMHIASGTGNSIFGTIQYAVKGSAPVNLQIDSDGNTANVYLEGQTAAGYNLLVSGSNNAISVSSLGTPSGNITNNMSITGVGNTLTGRVFALTDVGLTGSTFAPSPTGMLSVGPGNVVNGKLVNAPTGGGSVFPEPPAANATAHNLITTMSATAGITVTNETTDYPSGVAIGPTGTGKQLAWTGTGAQWYTSGAAIATGSADCLLGSYWVKAIVNSAEVALTLRDEATGNIIPGAYVRNRVSVDGKWYEFRFVRCGLSGYANVRLRLTMRNQTSGEDGATLYVYNPYLSTDISSPPSVNKTALVASDAVSGRVLPDGAVLPVVTVANLPACGAVTKGLHYIVSDANAVTYGSTVAGGGANTVPVFCDGSAWLEH